MPIYEYKCSNCGTWDEVTSSMGDMTATIICDVCSAVSERKFKSAPGVNIALNDRAAGSANSYYYSKDEQRKNAVMGTNPK